MVKGKKEKRIFLLSMDRSFKENLCCLKTSTDKIWGHAFCLCLLHESIMSHAIPV